MGIGAVDRGLPKPFSPAAFRRAWLDESLTGKAIARQFGIREMTAHDRAQRLGLPRKPNGSKSLIDRAEFTAMWTARVLREDMARHFACHRDTITRAARRFGLPCHPASRGALVTMDQYREMLLAERMRTQAETEQRAVTAAWRAMDKEAA